MERSEVGPCEDTGPGGKHYAEATCGRCGRCACEARVFVGLDGAESSLCLECINNPV